MNRLRKGDQVKIMRGSQKGKEGKIKEIFVKENKAIVEGIYKFTTYKKGRGLVEGHRPIDLSNLALCSPDKKKEIMKVSYVFNKDNKKERVDRKAPKT
ncbi:50S ribosomal protein L24 [Candidatus Mycoplasma haematolamae str. Purdue]|uniref:Large ribosomal subunit protein uL24 n=1 Tax=Mycoplasma haematolamae (strain Purdue) TaxID=1212765 RepID=I7C6J9_MYCHA|nr:50S ribosomal protein L24 [Candidatus Mycoplasma haematolamae]AFO52147.1 50S ribosomal protein L24 [Candidatus Mycoplasma haematolamae str. Purdue]